MRTRLLIVLLVSGIVLLDASVPALAAGLVDELKIGVLAHDVPDLWSGFQAEPDSVDINVEALLSPSVNFAGGTLQPALGASINTAGSTSKGYLDARWQYETASGLFFGLGVGAAIHDGQIKLDDWDRKAFGSRVLFHIPVEIGYRFDAHNSVSAYFEHISNAYTVFPNEGMDRLGVRYGYRFDAAPARERSEPEQSGSYDWSGIYVGGQAGGAWGSFSNDWPLADHYFPAGTSTSSDATAFFGGGQVGLQQQWGNWVTGLEAAAVQFASMQATSTAPGIGGLGSIANQANWSLMLTPRLGYAFDRWLGYGKAGYVLTDLNTREALGSAATDMEKRRGGWVAGGGIDYALTDAIILGAEYQHIFVGSVTSSGVAPAPTTFGNVKSQGDIDMLAAHLNFKFNRPPAN